MKSTAALSAATHDASLLGTDTAMRPISSQPQAASLLLSSARALVHDNPWYAALLAVGAGILAGLLLRRHS